VNALCLSSGPTAMDGIFPGGYSCATQKSKVLGDSIACGWHAIVNESMRCRVKNMTPRAMCE
jgi:hypothetical protein